MATTGLPDTPKPISGKGKGISCLRPINPGAKSGCEVKWPQEQNWDSAKEEGEWYWILVRQP